MGSQLRGERSDSDLCAQAKPSKSYKSSEIWIGDSSRKGY
ncbi:uncharacterized protein G2W53_012590 [Senna tora]|uniref:Uncharacterized protein n=1 Tax=Senna tora TaxID=362788 RepID=A0A834WPW6_9FABA|nr:uncharacterized protein G2W53_012590 [Senna tora]